MSKLNIKQLKFIDNLFLGWSQIKAYKEAGYEAEGHSAESSASEILRNPEVAAEIKKRLADITYRNRIRLGRISETALAQLLKIIQIEDVKDKVKDKKDSKSAKNPNIQRVKLDAVKDALDRAGLKPVERMAIGGDKELEPLRVIIEKGKDG